MSVGVLKLFEAVGIELEYMIVDRSSLDILPYVEKILRAYNGGELIDEVTVDGIRWSNELVCHVVEVKGDGPFSNLNNATQKFFNSIQRLNSTLGEFNAELMPTGMHPWMNPIKETVLWPHGQREIYAQFDKIFGCQGHGWSNLQSMHINLPYSSEEEFGKLHAAIRLILPLVPALCASSPVYDGKLGKFPSNRLYFYQTNQQKIPSITGQIIPESVTTFNEYEHLLAQMYQDIAPFDPEALLQGPWLNSRGAIPKFDYGCIEIRLADVQECPAMDLAIAQFIVVLLKKIVREEYLAFEQQKKINTEFLREIYLSANRFEVSKVPSQYGELFNLKGSDSFVEFLYQLYSHVKNELPSNVCDLFEDWFRQGNLASRIKLANVRDKDIKSTYKELSACLRENRLFIPI